MRIEKFLLLTVLGLMTSLCIFAQEDTAFINNYKKFRSLVDPLPTYSVYLVPFQSSKKYPLSESKEYLREAYHFLRQKTIDLKSPRFIIGVLIDDLEVDYPTSAFLPSSSKAYTNYSILTKYRASINILVHTENGSTFQFPLVKRKEFSKLGGASVSEGFEARPGANELAKYMADKKKFYPNNSDFKAEFFRILEKYKKLLY